MITNGYETFGYGLPCKYVGNIKPLRFNMLYERALAKHYLLEHERHTAPLFSKRREKAQEEWEGHALKFSEFIIDYLLQICFGEARHLLRKSTDATMCARCRQKLSEHTGTLRATAGIGLSKMYKTYPEALEHMVHVFYEHNWGGGSHGGWKWGNIAIRNLELYQALKARDMDAVSIVLDQISQLQHNGGSCFNGKFDWISFDLTLIYRILWAKKEGKPCCLEFLGKIAAKTTYNYSDNCEHALALTAIYPMVPLMNKDKIPAYCNICSRALKWADYDATHLRHKVYCEQCGICTCPVRLGMEVHSCGKPYDKETHKCVNWCDKCTDCISDENMLDKHKLCHICYYPWDYQYCLCKPEDKVKALSDNFINLNPLSIGGFNETIQFGIDLGSDDQSKSKSKPPACSGCEKEGGNCSTCYNCDYLNCECGCCHTCENYPCSCCGSCGSTNSSICNGCSNRKCCACTCCPECYGDPCLCDIDNSDDNEHLDE